MLSPFEIMQSQNEKISHEKEKSKLFIDMLLIAIPLGSNVGSLQKREGTFKNKKVHHTGMPLKAATSFANHGH